MSPTQNPIHANINIKKKPTHRIPLELENTIISLLKQSIEPALTRSIEKAVTENFAALGFNNASNGDLQRDLSFLHTLRKRCEESSSLFFRIVLSSTIAAMAIALWEGVKVMLKR